ncbi:MAG: rod shape-determining protein MreC [Ghiorsea sp.]|nr:rod shape-determining protein MreC [Ghiorsea sp.]
MTLGRSPRFKSAHVWWVFLFLIIILLSFKYPVGQRLQLAVAPLLHGIQAPVRWYQDWMLWFESKEELQSRYLALEMAHAKQQALVLETEALRTENQQLRAFLNIQQIQHYAWRVARVISRGPERKSRHLMLEVQRAQKDDVVVSHQALIGLIAETNDTHAVVRTILDASVTVPVTMFGSNLAALVRGDGEYLKVDFVPLTQAPNVGDVLVTSGAGGIFPAGLAVARVEKVIAIDGGVFAEVQASPIAAWQRDAWLAVVVKLNAVDGK